MQMMKLIGLVLLAIVSSMAYPYPPGGPYYGRPDFDGFYPAPYPQPIQPRSGPAYYQPPVWPALERAIEAAFRNFVEDESNFVGGSQDIASVEGGQNSPLFNIPAVTNGNFHGPLAVVDKEPGKRPTTEYIPIIDGPNWPFIERSLARSNVYYENGEPVPYYRPFYFPYLYVYRN